MYYNYDIESKNKVLNMTIDEIKKSKDPKDLIICGKLRTDAPVDELAEIIKSFSSKDIVEFAIEVPNAPVDKLSEAIIDKGDEKWISEYILNVKYVLVDEFANKVAESKCVYKVCDYAKDNENLKEFVKYIGIAISKGNNVASKEYYAKNIAKMPVDEFVKTYSDIIFVALEEDENFAE